MARNLYGYWIGYFYSFGFMGLFKASKIAAQECLHSIAIDESILLGFRGIAIGLTSLLAPKI